MVRSSHMCHLACTDLNFVRLLIEPWMIPEGGHLRFAQTQWYAHGFTLCARVAEDWRGKQLRLQSMHRFRIVRTHQHHVHPSIVLIWRLFTSNFAKAYPDTVDQRMATHW